MPMIINLDVMLAKRKMSVTELSQKVGITMANLSILKTGKARAIRFSTLEAICEALSCQPGDILRFEPEPAARARRRGAGQVQRTGVLKRQVDWMYHAAVPAILMTILPILPNLPILPL